MKKKVSLYAYFFAFSDVFCIIFNKVYYYAGRIGGKTETTIKKKHKVHIGGFYYGTNEQSKHWGLCSVSLS